MSVLIEDHATIKLPDHASCAVVWESETQFVLHTAHEHPFSVNGAEEIWVVFPEYGDSGLLLEIRPIGTLPPSIE